jgi:hypothetical protein
MQKKMKNPPRDREKKSKRENGKKANIAKSLNTNPTDEK